MAVTSTIEYCTDRDLQDIFPHIAEYDLKRRIYNWISGLADFYDSTLDVYFASNSGLVTQLFHDGSEVNKLTFNTTETTKLDGALTPSATVFYVDAGHGLGANDIVKIDNEYIRVVSVSDDTITISTPANNRGIFGTSTAHHANDTSVYKILDASTDYPDTTEAGKPHAFVYDTDLDVCILLMEGSPNDLIMEAGDDWATVKTRFRRKASRLIESHLDNRLSREVLKDREGNYPEIIVHVTALQTVILLLKAHDPNNDVIAPFQDELNELIDGLKSGSIVLPAGISSDSSKGVVREVSVDSSSDLRLIELKGNYHQYGYDNIKVIVDLGGIIGTSTYSVYVKDNDKLKTDQVVTSEKITGDYDLIVSGLYMRWSGDDVLTATTTTNDEYEIEVHSSSINTSVPSIGSVVMTRR